MGPATATLTDLRKICHRLVERERATAGSFQPTGNQVFFFMLARLQKQGLSFRKPGDRLAGQEAATLTKQAGQVVAQLGEWGPIITALKARDDKAWELLRLQMETGLKGCPVQGADLKADAVQNALLKLFIILEKMVTWPELEAADVITLVVNERTKLSNIYNFHHPFYAFARRIAYNELMSQLRQEINRPLADKTFEELEAVAGKVSSATPASQVIANIANGDESALQALRQQLRQDLSRLLAIIKGDLTRMQRRVIWQTLAARSQFWRALEATGLSMSAEMQPTLTLNSAGAIAQVLRTKANTVRVHRAKARQRVAAIDPTLAGLLDSLISRHKKNGYRATI